MNSPTEVMSFTDPPRLKFEYKLQQTVDVDVRVLRPSRASVGGRGRQRTVTRPHSVTAQSPHNNPPLHCTTPKIINIFKNM